MGDSRAGDGGWVAPCYLLTLLGAAVPGTRHAVGGTNPEPNPNHHHPTHTPHHLLSNCHTALASPRPASQGGAKAYTCHMLWGGLAGRHMHRCRLSHAAPPLLCQPGTAHMYVSQRAVWSWCSSFASGSWLGRVLATAQQRRRCRASGSGSVAPAVNCMSASAYFMHAPSRQNVLLSINGRTKTHEPSPVTRMQPHHAHSRCRHSSNAGTVA